MAKVVCIQSPDCSDGESYNVDKGTRLFQICTPDLSPIGVKIVSELKRKIQELGGIGDEGDLVKLSIETIKRTGVNCPLFGIKTLLDLENPFFSYSHRAVVLRAKYSSLNSENVFLPPLLSWASPAHFSIEKFKEEHLSRVYSPFVPSLFASAIGRNSCALTLKVEKRKRKNTAIALFKYCIWIA